MNFLGIEQTDTREAEYLKSRFPIRYGFIDFGLSRRFGENTTHHLVDVYTGRFHKAPELDLREPYNPFAADVYQSGSMLLILFYVRLWHFLTVHSVLIVVFSRIFYF